MSRAILTRYMGPTNHRGSRVKATTYGKSMTVSWDPGLGIDENHDRAALLLMKERGWSGRLACANHPDGTGRIYVMCDLAGSTLDAFPSDLAFYSKEPK